MSAESSSVTDELIQSNHKFSIDIYKQLSNGSENFVFSPISLQIALLLAHSGANGKTEEEMRQGLSLNSTKEKILEGTAVILEILKNPNLTVASQIFVEKQYNLKTEFINKVKQHLRSEFCSVDFKKSAEKSIQIINLWVAEKTHNKISDLISPGSLSEYTRLLLVNAVHFKDDWKYVFPENETNDQPFYLTKDKSVNVPMMHLKKKFRFSDKKSYNILEIPYKDEDFRMVVVLPHGIDQLSEVEKQLHETEFAEIFQTKQVFTVHLSLPKFKVEKFVEMKKILKELGMETMFGDCADFSEMYEPGEDPLFVSDVLHKAVIEVNEKGSEAAAATAVKMLMKRSLTIEKTADFVVDHPFIFFILYRNLILFMGKNLTGQ